MKKDLLDKIVQVTIREFLDYLGETGDTVGAPAPPEGGLGTADQPALDPPSSPPPSADIKGIHIIDPRNPAKTTKLTNLTFDGNVPKLTSDLRKVVSSMIGHRTQVGISNNALRMVRDWFFNRGTAVFLYIGTPEDNTYTGLMLYADKNISNARSKSIGPEELTDNSGTAPEYYDTGNDASPSIKLDEIKNLKQYVKCIIKEYMS